MTRIYNALCVSLFVLLLSSFTVYAVPSDVTIRPELLTHTGSVEISLVATPPLDAIYYSINSTNVTDTSEIYTGAFTYNKIGSLTVCAVVYFEGVAGNTGCKTFIIKSNSDKSYLCVPECDKNHGYCDVTLDNPICVCDEGWAGDDCGETTKNGLLVVLDNEVLLYITGALVIVGIGVIIFIVRRRARAPKPNQETEFMVMRGKGTNTSKKLSSTYGRVKAPNFVFEVDRQRIVLGRPNKQEFVDINLAVFPTAEPNKISRVHAIITLTQGELGECFVLQNCGKHGTRVDGRNLRETSSCVLYDRSIIDVCGVRLVFRDDKHSHMKTKPSGQGQQYDDDESPVRGRGRSRSASSQSDEESRPARRHTRSHSRRSGSQPSLQPTPPQQQEVAWANPAAPPPYIPSAPPQRPIDNKAYL